MIRSNFYHFAKMQVLALSQIVWPQLLCLVLYPTFFNQKNVNNDLANTITYAIGLLMFCYLIIRNFAFNDAKYKTKLLFSILPVAPKTVIGTRWLIIYLFCVIATPILILFSNITHLIMPDIFAAVPIHILPYGFLLLTVFLPVEFLIFDLFDTQKADIIGALSSFAYMALMFLLYKYLKNHALWLVVLFLAVSTNIICFTGSQKLYKNRQV